MKVFDGLEIRDIDVHYSDVYDKPAQSKAVLKLTVLYKNGLNQACTLQVQGSVDEAFTDPVDIDNTISASASMSSPKYETVSDYFPYVRIKATCGSSPASGSFSAWILP